MTMFYKMHNKLMITIVCLLILIFYLTKDNVLLADETTSPSANSYKEQESSQQLLDSFFKLKEKNTKTANIKITQVENLETNTIVNSIHKNSSIFEDDKGHSYLELKLPIIENVKDYQFTTEKKQKLNAMSKREKGKLIIRILLNYKETKVNDIVMKIMYKDNLDLKVDKIETLKLSLISKFKKDKELSNEQTKNESNIEQQHSNNEHLQLKTNNNENSEATQEHLTHQHKNKVTTNTDQNSHQDNNITLADKKQNPQQTKSNKNKEKHHKKSSKLEKEDKLPSFNRDSDKQSKQQTEPIVNDKQNHHYKEYILFGGALLLAIILLISTFIYSKKGGHKR